MERHPAATGPAVLLVEDEPTIAITLGDDLEDRGYRVTRVPDGDDALRLLAAQPFDAVITDLRLPGASGLEIVRAVRRLLPAAPVLLITAFFGDDGRLPVGCRVLHKPFANEVVLDWLAAPGA